MDNKVLKKERACQPTHKPLKVEFIPLKTQELGKNVKKIR